MKHKIGVLTFHRPLNYGAALQAVALYKYVSDQLEHDVTLIDYRHPRIESDRKIFTRNFAGKKLYGKLRSFCHSILLSGVELHRIKCFNHFLKVNTMLSSPCTTDDELVQATSGMDTLIVGSDLVWNWDLDTRLNHVFFLEFAKKSKARKLSYASSVGVSHIPDQYRLKYREYLHNFNSISVREATAKELLSSLTEQTISVVCDPVFLIEKAEWEKMEIPVRCPSKYILFYILEFTDTIDAIISYIENKYQLPVVYFTLSNHFCGKKKCMYKYGPSEFLYLIHNADLIITNSFHGMAFSVLYNKEFFCIPHTSRGSRMLDLANELSIEHRIICNLDQLKEALKVQNGQSNQSLNDKIKNMRTKSERYLREAMK